MTTFLRKVLGHALFATMYLAVLALCFWIKSFWNEPLGIDGLLLSAAIAYPIYRALPVIDRLVSEPAEKKPSKKE